MRSYLGFLHHDARGDYTVTFPDFPGCVTAGSTPGEARAMAQETLNFHVEGLLEDGTILGPPMTLDEALQAEPANRQAVSFLVEVISAPRNGQGDAQSLLKGPSLADELIAERRAEAARE